MTVEWMTSPSMMRTGSFGQGPQDDIKKADVLVVAIGKPWMITPDFVKPSAIVIDIGTTRDAETGQLRGDVHPDAANVAAWLTPVPGGVGPVTVAMLLENTVVLAERFSRA